MIQPGSGLSNLQTRILSAIVLIAVAVALTWIGGFAFGLLASAIGISVFYEWQLITTARSTPLTRGLSWSCLIVVLAVLLFTQHILLMIGILFAGAALVAGLGGRESGYWPAFGLIYSGFPSIALTLLRGDTGDGFAAIFSSRSYGPPTYLPTSMGAHLAGRNSRRAFRPTRLGLEQSAARPQV